MVIRPRVALVLLVVVAGFGPFALGRGAPAPTSTIRVLNASHASHASNASNTSNASKAANTANTHRGPAQTSLDVALGGTATADTEAAGSPASNAIDGSASTPWCATQWTGSVTVDLGRPRTLDGLGLTLGATATTALVNFSAGNDPNALTPVPNATQQSAPAGDPAYWPTRDLKARYVKVNVTDNDGTPPCIGELRLFAAMPLNAIRDRGADLSFQPQEEAAGAHFTDAGAPGTPLSILNRHGLNYVRLRLWVNPPQGYSDLTSDLNMAKQIAAAGDKLYLDIHYSDFWADPQHQDIPAAWQGRDLAQLTDTVRTYTYNTIKAFAAHARRHGLDRQ